MVIRSMELVTKELVVSKMKNLNHVLNEVYIIHFPV